VRVCVCVSAKAKFAVDIVVTTCALTSWCIHVVSTNTSLTIFLVAPVSQCVCRILFALL